MTDFETQVRDALDAETAAMGTAAGLADAVIARGGRARRRRQVGGAVTVMAVAAAVVAGPQLVDRSIQDGSPPVAGDPTLPTDRGQSGIVVDPDQPVAPWVSALPDGPEPQTPWLQGATYRFPSGGAASTRGFRCCSASPGSSSMPIAKCGCCCFAIRR